MALSGNWKVTVTAAKGIKGSPDTLEFELEGKSSSFPMTAAFGATETPLQASKTFYLYGNGSEHNTPLHILLKKGDAILCSTSLPHDKAETMEEWIPLKAGEQGVFGVEAGHLKIRSQWISKIYHQPEGTNYLLLAAYTLLFSLWALSNVVLIPVTFNLLATSVSIIYIGCHRSLKLRDKGAITDDEPLETISSEDAYKFPIVGSCVLFSLYLAFKMLPKSHCRIVVLVHSVAGFQVPIVESCVLLNLYLAFKFFDKDWVNWLLAVYFSIIGAAMLTCTFEPIVSMVLRTRKAYGPVFHLPLLGKIDLGFTPADVVAAILAIALAAFWFKTKHWVLNNGFGIAFCIQGLERISLGSYKVGAILLCGLFFYDIFWVFGTEVMVTVAKSFDAPIKLLFPRAFASATSKAAHSMLGLGDIVIPGIFIALLLRYDAERSSISPQASPAAAFSKPFFNTCIFAYGLGLGATIFIMNYFGAAQPALLYLVPACLISSGGTALVLKEMKALLAYSEEEHHDDSNRKEEEVKKTK